MDIFDALWTAAPDLKLRLLALIVIAQMVNTLRAYTRMSKERMAAAKAGRVSVDLYRATQNEPEDLAVFNRAVANQFEAPVLFYALVTLSLALGVSSWLTVLLAGAYVALRWLHLDEMLGAHVVLRRRKLFIRSVQVLMVLMAEVALSALLRI